MKNISGQKKSGRKVLFFFILSILLEVSFMGCTSFGKYRQDAEKFTGSDYVKLKPVLSSSIDTGRVYPQAGEIISEKHLEGLPEIVKNYLRESKVVGIPMVSTVQLRQTGRLRTSPEGKWMQVKAVEIYNIEGSEFLWYADVKMNPLVLLTGYDSFLGGHGSMKIKMYDLFSVVDASGYSIDQGGMVRYLNELMWFPMGYLHPSVSWGKADNFSAEVILTVDEMTVSGIIDFNSDGMLTNFTAKRYMGNGKEEPSIETWEVPMDSWREYHGVILPEHGYASWMLEDGKFEYIELTLEDIEFGIGDIWRP